jgi:hypothetical protein
MVLLSVTTTWAYHLKRDFLKVISKEINIVETTLDTYDNQTWRATENLAWKSTEYFKDLVFVPQQIKPS